ncbi:MAG: MarR family winged helix-turn-helix transcriptional regulator [Henriciella sp.]|uniref:MarR family winged helix-turn-helix transcriptional regulator n=1 Tax=Henriciella sp. TaxID=1968823 RepID=UPI003C71267A
MADEQAKQDFDLHTSPSHLLHRAQQSAVNLSAGALSDQGLTLRQFAVLAALAGEDGQSQARLVDQTGIDRSTLAEMVRRMELSGYIKRVISKEDKRAKAVSLMAKGRKTYEAALPHVQAADSELLSMIRSNRRSALIDSLARVSGSQPGEAAPEPESVETGEAKATSKSDKSAEKSKSKPAKSTKSSKDSKPAKAEKAEKPAKADKSDKKSSKKKKKKKKKS